MLNYNNLIAEGVPSDRIFITGNTVVDATHMASNIMNHDVVNNELSASDPELVELIKDKPFIVITAHRRENIGEPLKRICISVLKLARKYPKKIFIWTLHKNPLVREIIIHEMSDRPDNLRLIEAVTYPTMIFLVKNSQFMLTDSGGLQEEVVSFKKPIIILRENTERPEVVKEGLGFLVGSDIDKIVDTFEKLDTNIHTFKGLKNPYGDGRTSERILNFLESEEIQHFVDNYPDSASTKLKMKDLL